MKNILLILLFSGIALSLTSIESAAERKPKINIYKVTKITLPDSLTLVLNKAKNANSKSRQNVDITRIKIKQLILE